MCDYKTIAETKKFIVLDKYDKCFQVCEGYQSEADLERELIRDLINQGYEHLPGLNTPEKFFNSFILAVFIKYSFVFNFLYTNKVIRCMILAYKYKVSFICRISTPLPKCSRVKSIFVLVVPL